MHAWHARYERLSAVTGILFFGGLVLGFFVSIRMCEVVTITAMHPLGGYFAAGLRYADSHGRVLTNGEAVPVPLRLLTPPMYLLFMLSWAAGSLFLITGAAQILDRTPGNAGDS
jgi:hypothetical protein